MLILDEGRHGRRSDARSYSCSPTRVLQPARLSGPVQFRGIDEGLDGSRSASEARRVWPSFEELNARIPVRPAIVRTTGLRRPALTVVGTNRRSTPPASGCRRK